MESESTAHQGVVIAPAIDLIKKFEGCRLDAYLDPVGVPTIGYGHTDNVRIGQKITQEEADVLLYTEVNALIPVVRNMVKMQLSNNQYCALIDFAYNLGPYSLYHSHLLSFINAWKPENLIVQEFMKWNHAGGKVLPGLTRRRHAEVALYLS